MEYFEINEVEQLNLGIFANFDEDFDWVDMPWIDGVKITGEIRTPIQYNLKVPSRVQKRGWNPKNSNFFNTGGGMLLVSKHILDSMKPLSTHLTFYESIIKFKDTYLNEKYFTINLETSYAAANLQSSEFDSYFIKGQDDIRCFDKLILSQKKLIKIPKKEHLFRLQESKSTLIISEYGKNLVEENGIIGVEFEPLEIAD